VHTETVPAERTSSHKVQGPPCPKDPSTAPATIRWTASQASHLVARMPPEMQPPASPLDREVITASAFALVDGRKRRDSNPRCLSARSLSRSSTQRSAMTTPTVWAGHRPGRGHSQALLTAGECNHKCNHCGCAHRDALRPPAPQSEQGMCRRALGPYAHVLHQQKLLVVRLVAGSDVCGLKVPCSECRVVPGSDG
jgi:hypothetical protein